MARFVLADGRLLMLAAALAAAASAGSVRAAAPDLTPEQERFFEQQVRPLLAASCWECHGAKKQESGLRLDSRQGMIEGGDSGQRAVVPGEPDRSLLVQAINHVGDYQMPPGKKLSEAQIAVLTEWVKMGVPWPAAAAPAPPPPPPSALVAQHRQTHWAYQPIRRPAVPGWRGTPAAANNPLDAHIVAALDRAGLAPSPEADRRTLLRRLTFDLTGLPPGSEEVESFVAARAPDAYEREVDRLLASPRFGERWARHWLDVARYADTKGYAFQQERKYPYAYTYRDYVIRALNRDLPYDQFLVEQLAADRLLADPSRAAAPHWQPVDTASLAALGFLTTGRRFNNRNDDIDDQIDAVSRGLLGLTVGCARCHDHKYDAIPSEDYYSLYGVFANCSEPKELPLLASPGDLEAAKASAEYQKYEAQLAKLREEFDAFVAQKHGEFLDQARRQSADYLARLLQGETNSLLAKLPFMSLDPKDLRPRLLERWRRYLEEQARPDHPVWGAWHELTALPTSGFAEQAPAILARLAAANPGTEPGQCNPLVQRALAAEAPAARVDVARIYGQVFTAAYDAWKAAGGNEEALAQLAPETRQVAEILVGKASPTAVEREEIRQYLNRADRNKYQELQRKVESFQANSPVAPPRAMVVADSPQPTEPRVLIRGNPARPGKVVPRQFLLVLAGEARQPFAAGSGRLELAEAIASADNPLTPRVIVNRLWMHHCGEPLVPTPSDFGIRAEPPRLPELLDALASRLLESAWSLKAVHREIVCSATYRQASLDRPECRRVDPENRLWWRMNRRRLELESMRDTLLASAGQLDLAMYGRPVELTKPPFARRRGVYGFIDRQDLPGMFRVFDIASPDSSSPRRPRTTVPQQALFLMNSPFVVEQAEALAARPEVAAASGDDAPIAALYRLVLVREPDRQELATCRDFLAAARSDPASGVKLAPLAQLAQLLLLTNEAHYVD